MLALTVGFFVWLLGLCVGSFLNVVVYRLPLGLSISKPARSFCPHCKASIDARDNVPVLSWILLAGRCRRCRRPISAQYPLVEAATGLAFVLTFHLLFVAQARAGVSLTLAPADAPLLLAWLVLAAAMVACSAMDLTSYMVDTRITDLTTGAGILFYALWPTNSLTLNTAVAPPAAAALIALLVSIFMLYLTVWRLPVDPDESPPAAHETSSKPDIVAFAPGVITVLLLIGLSVWLLLAAVVAPELQFGLSWLPVTLGLLALFIATVLAGAQERAADEELEEAIESEAGAARQLVLRELLWLAPAIIALTATYWLTTAVPSANAAWQATVRWSPGAGITPIGGAAYAAFGAIVAAAAGWALRIVFTLAFGREAFGVGDIHILAAAGACAGWDIALLGLLLAVGLAAAGWSLSLLLKRSVVIPFGPWLALGFLAALWCSRPAAEKAAEYAEGLRIAYEVQPEQVHLGGAVLLAGAVGAFVIAKLVRRALERSVEK